MTLRRTILALPLLFASCPAWAQQPCEGLKSLSIPGIKITSAASVAAGSLALPGVSLPATLQVPDFCRVAATVGKEVRIELWMPRQWNHKLLGVGNGGMGKGGGPRVRSTPLMSVRSECGDGAGSSVLTAPFPSWTAKTVAPVKVSGEA